MATKDPVRRDRVKRLLVSVTAEERAGIAARASSVGMSVSAYLGRPAWCSR